LIDVLELAHVAARTQQWPPRLILARADQRYLVAREVSERLCLLAGRN
jgi:hypothetical protein